MTGLDLVRIARAAALEAADYIRNAPRPDSPGPWSEKSRHDFVSDVDRGAEARIAAALTRAVPGSRVIGEELSPELLREGLVWIVDPLDGTTNFLHGYPEYAVSIAAAEDGRLQAGVVVNVARDDVYEAAAGGGALRNGESIHVSGITDPGHALIGTGFPFKHLDGMDRYVSQFRRVAEATSGIRRAGSAALDLCAVACGAFDAFWELQLAPWDVAAGTLIVREAGGVVTDLDGNDIGIQHGPVVAGNPAMHGWLLGITSSIPSAPPA